MHALWHDRNFTHAFAFQIHYNGDDGSVLILMLIIHIDWNRVGFEQTESHGTFAVVHILI